MLKILNILWKIVYVIIIIFFFGTFVKILCMLKNKNSIHSLTTCVGWVQWIVCVFWKIMYFECAE